MERIEGVNYFDHQFLRQEDFQLAREHHVVRVRQHNDVAHTSGIVSGLVVTTNGDKRLKISYGRGIDRRDREVRLEGTVTPEAAVPLTPGQAQNPVVPRHIANADAIEIDLSTVLRDEEWTLLVKVHTVEREITQRVDPGVEGFARLEERPCFTIDDEPLNAADPYLVLAQLEIDAEGRIAEIVTDDVRSEPAGSVIGDDAITSRQLADNSVGTSELQDDAVTNAELGDDAVWSQQLAEADNATAQNTNTGRGVKTDHLADGAVTGAKIANATITQGNLAADSVGRPQLLDASVGPAELVDRAVESRQLAEADTLTGQDTGSGRGVKTAHLSDGAVTTPKVATAAITQDKLAADAVGSPQLIDGAVGAAELAPDAVVSAALAEADNASAQQTDAGTGVKTGHLANEAVTRPKLAVDVRDALAAGHLLFDPFQDELLSRYNVKAVEHPAAGRFVVRWTDPVRGTRALGTTLRPGVVVTPDLDLVLRREAIDPQLAREVLRDSLRDVLDRDPGFQPRVERAPRTPDYLVAIPDAPGGAVHLAWTPSVPLDLPIAGYDVLRDGVVIAHVAEPEYHDGYEEIREFVYAVVAVDRRLGRSAPRELRYTPPPWPPRAPERLSVEMLPRSVRLTWEHDGAARYDVFEQGVLIGSTEDRSLVHDDVVNGAPMSFQVRAVAADGESSMSEPLTAWHDDPTPPKPVVSLDADAFARGVVALSWKPPDDRAVHGFEVLRDGQQLAVVTRDTRFILDRPGDLLGAATYEVVSYDPRGVRSEPVSARVAMVDRPPQPPPPPATDVTVRLGARGAEVRWPFLADAAGFVVLRDGQLVGAVRPRADRAPLVFADTLVTPGPHRYQVEVFTPGGSSSVSDPVDLVVPDREPPTTPRHLAASYAEASYVELTAYASADDVEVRGYVLMRDDVAVAELAPQGSATLRMTDAPGEDGRTYRYALVAFDAAGNASEPAIADVTTRDRRPPERPGPPEPWVEDAGIGIGWMPTTDNVGVTGYFVYRDGVPILAVAGTRALDERVVDGVEYTYAIAAEDARGNRSAPGPEVRFSLSDVSAPTRPEGVTATALSPYVARVAWEASSDDVGVVAYDVTRDGASIGAAAGTALRLDDSGATPGAKHAYRVTARDDAGNASEPSEAAEVEMPADDIEDVGTVLAFAFLPGGRRQAHVDAITAERLDLRVVDVATGDDADGFLSVVAFEASEPPGRVVNLDELVRRTDPSVLAGALGGLTRDELRLIVPRVPAATIATLLPAVPDDRVADVVGAVSPGVLSTTVPRLSREERDRVLGAVEPPRVAELLPHIPRGDLAATVAALDDDRLGGVLGAASPVLLGDLVAESDGAQLERVVRAAPANRLGDALTRVDAGKRAAALDILTQDRLRETVLSASPQAAPALVDAIASDRLAGTVANANAGDRARLFALTPDAKLADVLATATASELERMLPRLDRAQLGRTLLAAENRRALADALPTGAVSDVILTADPGVASALPESKVAEVLVDADADGRRELVTRLDDATLAKSVAAAPEEARGALVAELPAPRLAGALTLAATRAGLVGAASDAQLAEVLASAGDAQAAAVAAEIPRARVAAITAAAPAGRAERLRGLLG